MSGSCLKYISFAKGEFKIFFSSRTGEDLLATAWEGIETWVEIITESFARE